MKKLAFISLAVLGFSGVNEIVRGMNPSDEGQCSQSNCNQKEIKLEESDKGKEKVDQVADVVGNDSETTAMIEGVAKRAKDLQEQMRDLIQQVKITQERANSLTMQETLSPEEKEKMRRYREIEKNEPTCCFPRPTPKQIVQEQLHRLYREKEKWSAYIDGRKKPPSRFSSHFDSFFEKEKQRFEQNKEIAIKRIPLIDVQIQSLTDRLNELN